jgi:hypothetical protein
LIYNYPEAFPEVPGSSCSFLNQLLYLLTAYPRACFSFNSLCSNYHFFKIRL